MLKKIGGNSGQLAPTRKLALPKNAIDVTSQHSGETVVIIVGAGKPPQNPSPQTPRMNR